MKRRLVVGCFAVFVDIQTFFLDARCDTQTVGVLDDFEEDEAAYEGPNYDSQDTESLYAQRVFRIGREDTDEQCSYETAYTMHGYGTNGIINFQDFINEVY
jgi:hypothetical protein